MKKVNRVTITAAIVVALVTLLSLVGGILANLLATGSFLKTAGLLSFSWVILVVVSIALGILVIFQTILERQVNKTDNRKVTTETKSIGIRINIDDKHVLIEAPDAESVIEVLQEIHENRLKAESQLKAETEFKFEEKKPEVTDVPENKGGEEENKTT